MDFRLSDEQMEWQTYCRKFATEVIRPVAVKYDREQSVPWPVIKEARKWQLSGLDYIQKMASDPEGLLGVIYAEELHWGCAGLALAISASGLRRPASPRRARRSRSPAGSPSATALATRSSSAPTRSPRPARAPT